ncbi:unnamed protein product, partial [Ectocarpus sp. 8 AP-2014]
RWRQRPGVVFLVRRYRKLPRLRPPRSSPRPGYRQKQPCLCSTTYHARHYKKQSIQVQNFCSRSKQPTGESSGCLCHAAKLAKKIFQASCLLLSGKYAPHLVHALPAARVAQASIGL